MKTLIGLLCIVGGTILAAYLSFVWLLYGGIMQAITNWQISNSAVVIGILKAVFFGVGLIPGALVIAVGLALLEF